MTKNKGKKFIFDSFITLFSTVIDKLSFFILNIIIARFLTPELFGEYTTAIAFATFFSVFTDIGINQTLIRSINLNPDNESRDFGAVVILKSFLSAIVYCIIIAAALLLQDKYSWDIIYLIFIFGAVRIGNDYLNTFYALYDAKSKFLMTSFLKILYGLSLIIVTYTVTQLNGDYYGFAFVRLSVVVIVVLFFIIIVIQNFNIKFDLKYSVVFLKEAIPFAKSRIYVNIYQRFGLLILPFFHGSLSAGFFNNGIVFLNTLFFIPSNFSRVLLPYLYKEPFEKNKDKIQYIFNASAVLTSIMGFFLQLVFFIYANDIIILIFGEKYIRSALLLKILSFAIIPLFSLSGTFLTALDMQNIRTRLQGITLAFSIVVNLVMIFFWGDVGAAVAVVVTRLVLYVLETGYLWIHGYFEIRIMIITILKLIVLSVLMLSIKFLFLEELNWMISFVVVFITFVLSIFFLVITKNDIKYLVNLLKR